MKLFRFFMLIWMAAGLVAFVNYTPSAGSSPTEKKGDAPSPVASVFEGKIRIVKTAKKDTVCYLFYVKGNSIRVEKISNCEKNSLPSSYFIYDLTNNSIKEIVPRERLYSQNKPSKSNTFSENGFRTTKTGNFKTINGYTCYQWRVRNEAEKTEMAYWVANSNFYFFGNLVKLWDKSDKYSSYFMQIPESQGGFPMLTEERSNLRDTRMEMRVTEIKPQALNAAMFQVPAGYREKN